MKKRMTGILALAVVFSFFCGTVNIYAGSFTTQAAPQPEVKLEDALGLIKDGKYREAIVILESLKAQETDSKKVLFHLGVAYLHLGDYAQARKYLLEVETANPSFLPVHYFLSMIYEKEKNYISATDEWKKVLELADSDSLKVLANKHIARLESKIKENENKK